MRYVCLLISILPAMPVAQDGFIPPTGTQQTIPGQERSCNGDAACHPTPEGPAWNGWSTSVTNSRFWDAKAAGLAACDIPKLKLKWALILGSVAVTRGQPVVDGLTGFKGTVFAYSGSGYMPGTLLLTFSVDGK